MLPINGLLLCLLALALLVIFVTVVSNCIYDETSGKSPFWWVFFFGLFGAIIYILLGIRDYTCSTAIRLPAKKPEDDSEPEV